MNYCIRLHRGDDLLAGIERVARENHVAAAVIISGVGCVQKARLRGADGVTLYDIDENMEIVSLNGTVSEKRTHLHIALSKKDLSVVGGHLVDGCTVNTTAEIVLAELEDTEFSGVYDAETGYDELVVKKIRKNRVIPT